MLKSVYETSMYKSDNSAQVELDKYLESIEGRTNLLKNEVYEFSTLFANSDVIKIFVTGLKDVLSVINKISDATTVLVPIMGAAFGVSFVKNLSTFKALGTEFSVMQGAIAEGGVGIEAYADRFALLDVNMQKNLLTSKVLSAEQKELLSGMMATIPIKDVIIEDDSLEYLAQNNLINSTKKLTLAQLENLMTNEAINAKDKERIAQKIQLIKLEQAEGSAIRGLGLSWKSMLKSFAPMIIITGIMAIVNWISQAKQKAEELAGEVNRLSDELDSNLKTLNQNKTQIKDLADKYDRLRSGVDNLGNNVSLSNEEFAEYNQTTKQIVDMFPNLLTGYNKQGNAIVNLTDTYRILNEEIEKSIDNSYRAYLANGDKIFASWKDSNKNGLFSYSDKTIYEAAQEFVENKNSASAIGKFAFYTKQNNKDGAFYLSSPKALDKLYTEALSVLDTKGALLEEKTGEVRQYILSAFKYSDEIKGYNLSEEANAFIEGIIDNISIEDAYTILSPTDATAWLRNLIQPFKDNEKVVVDGIDYLLQDAIKEAMSIDINKLPITEAVQLLNNFFEAIAQAWLDEEGNPLFTPEELMSKYGFGDVSNVYTTFENITDKLDVGSRIAVYKKTKDFTYAEIKRMVNSYAQGMSGEEWIAKYDEIVDALSLDWKDENIKKKIDDFQSNTDKLSSAWKTLAAGGELTESEIIDLKQEFADLDTETGDLAAHIKSFSADALETLITQLKAAHADDGVIRMFEEMFRRAFSLKEEFMSLNDAISQTQSKIDSYNEAKFKVTQDDFSPIDLVELLNNDTDFRTKYQYLIEDLRKQLAEGTLVAGDDYDKALSEGLVGIFDRLIYNTEKLGTTFVATHDKTGMMAGTLAQIADQSELVKIGLNNAGDAINKMRDSYKQLYDVQNEYETNGDLSAETLNSIMSSEPQLIDRVQDYLMDKNADTYNALIEGLKEAYNEDLDNYYKYMKYKASMDGDFYAKYVIDDAQKAIDELSDIYSVDLKNYATIIDAKNALDKERAEAQAREAQKQASRYDEEIARREAELNNTSGSMGKTALSNEINRLKGLRDRALADSSTYSEEAEFYKDASDIVDAIFEKVYGDKKEDLFGNGDSWKNIFDTELKKQAEESKKVIDWFEYLLDEFNIIETKINTAIETAESAKGKNSLLDSLIAVDTNKMKAFKRGAEMYQNYANTFLEKIPEQYRAMAQNGNISISEFYSMGANDKVVEAIQNYRTYRDKAADAENQSNVLGNAIKTNLVTQVQNLNTEFERLNKILTTATSNLQSVSSLVGAMGYNEESEASLTNQLADQRALLGQLQQQRADAKAQMDKALQNGVVKGSDEWETMQGIIDGIDSSILSTMESIEGLTTKLNELPFKRVEQLSTAFSNLSSTLSFIRDEMDLEVVTNGGMGGEFTTDAMTAMGTLVQDIEFNKNMVEEYGDAIEELNRQYENGEITLKEYNDRYATLSQNQQSAYKAQKQGEEGLTSIYKTYYQERINLVNDLIEKRKEELAAQKEAYNWQKNILNKTKELLIQERKVNALAAGSTTDRATAAQYTTEKENFNNKLSDWDDEVTQHNDEQYDKTMGNIAKRYTESQQNMTANVESVINQLLKNGYVAIGDAILYVEDFYKKNGEVDLESLRKTIKGIQDTSQKTTDIVNENSKDIGKNISDVEKETGVNIDDDITGAWNNAGKAVDNYKKSVSDMNSNTSGIIKKTSAEIKKIQDDTENETRKLIAMFGLDSATTQNTINSINNSLSTSDGLLGNVLTQVQAFLSTNTTILNESLGNISTVLSNIKTTIEETKTPLDETLNSAENKTTNILEAARQLAPIWAKMFGLKIDETFLTNFEKFFARLKEWENKTLTITFKAKLDDMIKGVIESAESGAITLTPEMKRMLNFGQSGNFISTHSDGGVVNVQKYATGGVITANSGSYVSAGSPLDAIARKLGEDTMIAAKKGERVLTMQQNLYWEKWTDAMPKLMNLMDSIEGVTPMNNSGAPIYLNVDAGITVNGNIDSDFKQQFEDMQKRAMENTIKKISNTLRDTLGLKVNMFNKSVY